MLPQHEDIVSVFTSFFESRGYQETPELSLMPEDPSLLFTNSTIVGWKDDLLNRRIPSPGYHSKQRCLRMRCLNDTFDHTETQFDSFLGNFNMVGVVTEHAEDIQTDILQLLDTYGVSSDARIDVVSGMSFTDVLRNKLPYRTDALDSYTWVYGIDGVGGVGATISLRHADTYREIGQLVEISRGQDILGYEFGFGVETFMARANQIDDYSAWSVFHAAPAHLRFKAFLDAVGCLCYAGSISEMGSKHKREVRRLARHVLNIERSFEVKDISSILVNHSIIEFGNEGPGVSAVGLLDSARDAQNEAASRLGTVLKSLIVRGYSPSEAVEKAKDRNRKQYHVPEDLAQQIYSEVVES